MSRSSRLLFLLQTLTTRRRPVTASKLAAELNVSERTVYRDLAELASQGVRVEGEPGVGYILKPGFFLPPLMLTEDEAEAVLLGLDFVDQRGDEVLLRAVLHARAKIQAVLHNRDDLRASVPLATIGPAVSAFPENAVPLSRLRAAIRSQSRLDLTYRNEQGAESKRTTWPLQLSFLHNARILIAWCELREDFRTFRTDRILSVAERERYLEPRATLLRRFRAKYPAVETQDS
jgi:predicted DNA-binding transcriptional regulator YafY